MKVIEFNRDDKRILGSHLRYLEDIQREADDQVRKVKEGEVKETRNVVRKTQAKIEKTTLGDLDALAQLKEQFTEGEASTEADDAKEEEK